MTTADPEQTGMLPAGIRARLRRTSWFSSLEEALERPLTSYYLLLGASVLLLGIGLIMVMSASSVYAYRYYHGDSYAVVKKQLMWVLLGVPLAYVAMRIPVRWIRRLVWPGYAISLVLLLATAFFGITVNGNRNWLALGPVQIQPSEIAKLALVLWAAHVYALKERRLHRISDVLVPVVPGIGIATGFVLLGDDLGTALVFLLILLAMLWVVGAPGKLFTLSLSIIGVAVLFLAAITPARMARITSFTDPFKQFHDAGWQPVHGLYALSTGGWFGVGIGGSQQKWGDLPEAHTDFIFAVLGEELGLVGTLLVIGLFLILAYACVRIARQAADPFVRYVSFGVVVWLVGQAIINIGMVLALLPVIGIPLPLVSYGGSALLPSMIALGLVLGFARREPEAARALAAKKTKKPPVRLARRLKKN